MNKIVTDFAPGDPAQGVKDRLVELAEARLGAGATSAVSTWGDLRGLLNTGAPLAYQIADLERGASFRAKLNDWHSDLRRVIEGLFAQGNAGAFPDAQNIDGVFRDNLATLPAEYGLKVGFVTDVQDGEPVLGPELVTNGTFDTDSDWIKGTGWTISGGVANATVTNYNSILQPVGAQVGKTYKVSFSVTIDSGALGVGIGSSGQNVFPITTSGSYTRYITPVAETSNGNLYFRGNESGTGNFTGTIDNISVRELPSQHATQANDALRPLYGRAPSTGRRNLLKYTEQFDNAAWNKLGASIPSITANNATAPDGSLTADEIIFGAATDSRVQQSVAGTMSGASYTFSVWLRVASGSRTVRIGTSNANSSKFIDVNVGAEWARFTRTFTAGTDEFPMIVNQPGTSGSVFAWGAQLEEGSTATAYQRVTTDLDVTEAGVSSPEYLRFDLTDDKLSHTFPAGFTGDVMLFGRNGSWIENGVTIAAGGVLDIGPTTITGGTPGALRALGDVVGWLPVGKALTEAEKAYLVAYYRERGAKGLLVPGSELVTNGTFDSDTDWAKGTGWTIGGGVASCDGSQTANSSLDTSVNPDPIVRGKTYVFEMDVVSVSAGTVQLLFSEGGGSTGIVATSAGSYKVLLTVVNANTNIRVLASPDFVGTIDNVSVRELIPQEAI